MKAKREKLIKYNKDAKAEGIFLLCKNCGKEVEIKINNRK